MYGKYRTYFVYGVYEAEQKQRSTKYEQKKAR